MLVGVRYSEASGYRGCSVVDRLSSRGIFFTYNAGKQEFHSACRISDPDHFFAAIFSIAGYSHAKIPNAEFDDLYQRLPSSASLVRFKLPEIPAALKAFLEGRTVEAVDGVLSRLERNPRW